MTDKTIMSIRQVGGDCFRFYYSRKGGYNLEHFLTFDPNLYFIYTMTGREIKYSEFLEFKFCSYTFFKKELHNKYEINKWIDFIGQFGTILINKPFPPIEIMNKIKIKK